MNTRVANVQSLIENRFGGRQVDFCKQAGVASSQVTQWTTGYRSLGEKAARKMEASLGLPSGWMDQDHGENHPPPVPAPREAMAGGGATLGETLARLGETVSKADAGTRETISKLVAEAVMNPATIDSAAAAIEALLRFSAARVETAALAASPQDHRP